MKIFYNGAFDLTQIVSRLVTRLRILNAIYSISVLYDNDGEAFFGFEAESRVLEGIVDAIASDYWSTSKDGSLWSAVSMIAHIRLTNDENVFAVLRPLTPRTHDCESDQHPHFVPYHDGLPDDL